jgi:hypothetical protein
VKDFIKTQEETKAQLAAGQQSLGDTRLNSETRLHPHKQDNLNELTNTEKSLKKQVAQTGWSIARDTANIHLSMAKV